MTTLTDIVPDIQDGWECQCSPFGHDTGCPNDTPLPVYTPPPKKARGFLQGPMKDNECPYLPKTAAALEWALASLGITVRQNMRSHAVEWCKDAEWLLLNGRAAARFRSDIEAQFVVDSYKGLMPLRFGRESFNESLDALLFDHEIDPFLEYLDGLPEPTGRRKLSGSLAHCFDVSEGYDALAEWASTAIFLGSVWRAYQPGTVLDEIPILAGPGGIGKTTFLRLAPPQHIPGLYGSGLDLAETPKGKVEALQGRVIVELADMMGSDTGDSNRIKDFISRVDDGSVRMAYRRDPEPSPRRCVIVGTADRAHFLQRDKNPRRFVPVVLTGGSVGKVIKYMASNRDRLWSEAKDQYTKGVPPRLPDELKIVAYQKAKLAMV